MSETEARLITKVQTTQDDPAGLENDEFSVELEDKSNPMDTGTTMNEMTINEAFELGTATGSPPMKPLDKGSDDTGATNLVRLDLEKASV